MEIRLERPQKRSSPEPCIFLPTHFDAWLPSKPKRRLDSFLLLQEA